MLPRSCLNRGLQGRNDMIDNSVNEKGKVHLRSHGAARASHSAMPARAMTLNKCPRQS